MKICIISTVAPRQMSMYSIYTDYFKNKNIEYDLIYFFLRLKNPELEVKFN